jgi:hypothetical protein
VNQETPDPMVKTTIRVPQSLLKAVQHRSIDEGKSFQEIVILSLEQYLKKGGR